MLVNFILDLRRLVCHEYAAVWVTGTHLRLWTLQRGEKF